MSSTHNVELKAFEQKVEAQLQQFKSQLEELESRAKGKVAQGEIDAIHNLRTRHHDIERKSQELKTVGEAKAETVKAQIDTELATLKSSVAELATKIQHAKAS
jgi:hypothetical protein